VATQPAKLAIATSDSSSDPLLIPLIDLFLSLVGGISRLLHTCNLLSINRSRCLLSD